MHPAQATRLEKERWPHRFCSNPRCLWRVLHLNRPDTPCLKHRSGQPAVNELTAVTAGAGMGPAQVETTSSDRN